MTGPLFTNEKSSLLVVPPALPAETRKCTVSPGVNPAMFAETC
jgi:hypothetical protein